MTTKTLKRRLQRIEGRTGSDKRLWFATRGTALPPEYDPERDEVCWVNDTDFPIQSFNRRELRMLLDDIARNGTRFGQG